MRFRKILSLLVAMAMLFSSVGITAMAEEEAVAKIGETSFATLAAAIEAATTGDEIDLCASVEKIPAITKAITIDGNGCHVTAKADEHQFDVIDGTVTLKNLVYDNGTEAIRTDYGNYGGETDDYVNLDLVIEGCTFDNLTGYAIMGGQSEKKTLKSLTVKNCIFNAGDNCDNYMVYAQQVGTLTITDCTFNGNDVTKGAIHTGDSTKTATVAKISGGTISGVARGVQIGNRFEGSNVSVSDVAFNGVTDNTIEDKTGVIYVHENATENVAVSATSNTATGCTNLVYNDGTENITSIITTFTGNTVDGNDVVLEEDGTVTEKVSAVAKIGDNAYTSFDEALTAANAMTGDVTVNIFGEVEFTNGMELNGSYDSITFVGKAEGAKITINQSAGGDYLEAHGKTVAFTDLTLAKANPAWSGNSGHMGNYFSVQGGTVTYTNCIFPNGACTNTGTATYNDCTFQNTTEYGLWVYDDALVTVNGGTIDSKKGIKVYSEGEDSVTSTLTVKNATFTENITAKPAVAIGYAESITLIGNTYNNTTGVLELDSGSDADCEGVTFVAQDANGNDIASTLTAVDRSNSNVACGVLVDGKIYTKVTTAAAEATTGSTVTLLHDSTETVKFAEGVTLDTNGYTAENVTVATPSISGVVAGGFIMDASTDSYICSEITDLYATESVVLKLFDAEGTLLATTTLTKPDYYVMDALTVKFCIVDTSSSWTTVWEEGKCHKAYVPATITLYVDGQEMNSTGVHIWTEAESPLVWSEVSGVSSEPISVSTFGELVLALSKGADVKLANDITTTSAIVTSGVTATIDLNGKTLNVRAGDNKFNDESNITIKNGNINIDGVIVAGNAIFCLDEYEKTLVTTLTLDNVNLTGEDYSSAYGIFYIGASSVLNVNGGVWNLSNDTHTSGGVFKADDSGATLNVAGAEMTLHNVRRVVTYANTTITDSALTIYGDADGVDAEMEHGFNRSPLAVTNSTITMTDMVGRGITAQCGAVTISDNSSVTMTNCQEATIDVRNGQTVTVSENSTVTVDVAPTITSGTISGIVTVPPTGTVTPAYTKEVDDCVRVWGEGGANAKESFVLELFCGDTKIATTKLNNVGGIIDGDVYVTWNFFYPESNDEYWTTTWEEGHPNSAAQPDKVVLYADGVKVDENVAKMNAPDDLAPVVWEELGGVKYVVTGLSGSGTQEDPYLINNLDDLKWFRDNVNTYTSDGSNQYKGKYVKLNADIDLAGENWEPIGNNAKNDHESFMGIFDGDGHTIKNLYVNSDGDHLGFFARIGSYAEGINPTVKNITFENVDVSSNTLNGHGGSYVGGVIANAGGNSIVENVKVKGDIYVTGYGYVGGIVGHGYPDLTDCSVIGNDGSWVHAHYWCAGGIIGYAGEGGTPITNCKVEGLDIWSAYGAAAAVAGLLQDGNKLTNVSAKDVEVTSASDYCMGYIAGNGEESTLTDITTTNVTATANGKPITVTDAVATIGDTVYFDLESAFKAAQDGETVKLVRDVTIDKNIVVSKKNITFDGNGFTIKQSEGLTLKDYAAGLRFDGDSSDISKYNYTVKNVKFDGWKTRSVLAIHQCTATVDNVTINGTAWDLAVQSMSYGLLYLENTEITVKDSKFTNNNAEFVLTYNYGSPNSTAKLTIDECLFENNTVGLNAAAVYYVTGSGCTITNSEFKGNNITSGGNAATLYLGFQENCVVKGCLFENNKVHSKSAETTRVAGAIFFGYDADISENVFINNTASNANEDALGQHICTSVYYGNIDLSENYFDDGSKPENGVDYFVQHTTSDVETRGEATLASYYTNYAIDETTGNVVVSDLANANPVAKIGETEYFTLAEAIAAVGDGDAVIELLGDVNMDYNAREAYGTAGTTSITINGNGHTVTLNQKDSDWSSIGLSNADAKLVLNNMTIEKTGYGDTTGAWNTHAINFTCNVEMTDVTVNNSISVENGATLNNVTINEANGYYGLWIDGNGQEVTVNGGAINATNGGRGIKIADEYVDSVKQVTLTVEGTKFNTAKKAAVLVSSTLGAKVYATDADISNVAADSTNFVWIDEDWAAYYNSVKVYDEATKTQENEEAFPIKVSYVNDAGVVTSVRAYYKTLDELFAAPATQVPASNYIELRDNVVANNQVNVSYGSNRVYTFGTSVETGVTMDFKYADNWNNLPKFDLGENITMNVPYLYVIGGDIEIAGTINTGYLFLYGTGEGVTITETGVVNANVSNDKTVQVKGGTVLTVNGLLNTNTLNVWTQDVNNSELIVSGANAQVNAEHLHAWNGKDGVSAQKVVVENGATLTATDFQADRGSEVTVDAATLTANAITLGYGDNLGTLSVLNNGVITNGVVLGSAAATVEGPEGMNVTTSVENYKVVYKDGIYSLEEIVNVAAIGDVKYASLAEALAAAQDGDTVTLLADVTVESKHEISKNITIDLNDNTLTLATGGNTVNANVTIKNGEIAIADVDTQATGKSNCFISVNVGKELTLDDVNMTGDGYTTHWAVICAMSGSSAGSTLNIKNSTVNLANEKGLAGGFIKDQSGVDNYSVINVENTTMTLSNVSRGFVGGSLKLDAATITITGGEHGINGSEISAKNSKINISDGAGRALTVNKFDMSFENTDITLSNMGEGEIRFKTANAITIDEETSTLSLCNAHADVAGATINGKAITGTEEKMSTATVADGVTTIVNPTELFELGVTSVTLGNSLTANFYIDVDNIVGEDYYAVVKHFAEDKTIEEKLYFSDWETRESNGVIKSYVIPYENLAAKQMTDKLEVTVYYGNGNPASVTKVDSLRDYALRGINTYAGESNLTEEQNNVLIALVDMLNYGAAAQLQFNYREEGLANAGTESFQSYATSDISNVQNIQDKDDNHSTTTLVLNNNIVLTGYFKGVTENMYAIYSFTDHYGNAKSKRVEFKDFVVSSSYGHGVDVDELVIADAAQPVTITIYHEDNSVYSTLVDSMNSYLRRAMNVMGEDSIYGKTAKFTKAAYNTLH